MSRKRSQRTAPSRRRKLRIASIAATNSLACSARTRYSTVMSTGPSAGSGFSTTSGAGQCPEGVRSRPSAPCSGQRQVAARPPASASTATSSAVPLPNCWASTPHAKVGQGEGGSGENERRRGGQLVDRQRAPQPRQQLGAGHGAETEAPQDD